ncbi:MAG: hypothetical protein FWC97_00940 [Treponema sp.]|nr:hypothetical protein [Treponema sp.]
MTNKSSCHEDLSLLRQIPNVLRVRGFRLYLSNKQRLVDLWLNGGAAVLGHTPPNLLRELKNTASRGLYAPFPHFTEGRFFKALVKLFPEYSFRIYAAPPTEIAVNFSHGDTEIAENTEKLLIKIWRPFCNPASPFDVENTPMFIPVLSGVQTWRDGLPLGLCVIAAKNEADLARLPPSDSFSPILLATATRGIHDILAAPQRAKSMLPRIKKTLQNSRWQQHGIYLTLKHQPKADEWAALFRQFFEAGFLLPPTPLHPVILPGEISAGEEAKLTRLLAAS